MLISNKYLAELRKLHGGQKKWGHQGDRWAPRVLELIESLEVSDVLDYGCGQGALKKAVREKVFTVFNEYDPAIEGKNTPPARANLVVCTDVLEHVEPDCICDVLKHIHSLANPFVFLTIALLPARRTLPDGRNAHILLRSPEWWVSKLSTVGFAHTKWYVTHKELVYLGRTLTPDAQRIMLGE
jgi:2-polyprenyl-3-methyl-5-hydroxy-6-metoxy-1,4-benzoquinol methylase